MNAADHWNHVWKILMGAKVTMTWIHAQTQRLIPAKVLSYGSSKNSETINLAFSIFATDENLGTCPPSASSSSATSSEDLFRVITTAIIRPHTDVYYADKLEDNSRTSPKDYVSGDSSAKLEETEHRSFGPASTSRVSDIESIVHKLSSTPSPPVQVMDRSGGYEQYRIPSSVFARSKPSTPVEWSIASNESSFSIQIENSSFSRDHFITWGGDMPKPVELPKSSELIPSSSQPPGEAVMLDDDSSAGVEKILKATRNP